MKLVFLKLYLVFATLIGKLVRAFGDIVFRSDEGISGRFWMKYMDLEIWHDNIEFKIQKLKSPGVQL